MHYLETVKDGNWERVLSPPEECPPPSFGNIHTCFHLPRYRPPQETEMERGPQAWVGKRVGVGRCGCAGVGGHGAGGGGPGLLDNGCVGERNSFLSNFQTFGEILYRLPGAAPQEPRIVIEAGPSYRIHGCKRSREKEFSFKFPSSSGNTLPFTLGIVIETGSSYRNHCCR